MWNEKRAAGDARTRKRPINDGSKLMSRLEGVLNVCKLQLEVEELPPLQSPALAVNGFSFASSSSFQSGVIDAWRENRRLQTGAITSLSMTSNEVGVAAKAERSRSDLG